MMMRGKGYWMKVLKPVENYSKDGQEWAFDVSLDEPSKQEYLKNGGFKGYINNKGDERGDFLSFKRATKKRDGEDAAPFRIVGPDAKEWPKNKLIGNGSDIKVKYLLNEVNTGRNKGKLKPSALAIQVWELKAYEGGDGGDFEPNQDAVNDIPWENNDDDGEVA